MERRLLPRLVPKVGELKGDGWVTEMFVRCGGLLVWLHREYAKNSILGLTIEQLDEDKMVLNPQKQYWL